ncbi:MAG: platelet-activating factor acetylhydrolase IB subunit [Candidatus Eisenbacteria bacterium]
MGGMLSVLFVLMQAGDAKPPPALRPEPRADDWWQTRQASVNARVKQGNVDLLFLGDSITQGWETEGKDVWAQRYAPRRAVNLGFSGDRTQHLLWRLDHGNLDGIKPKAAVLMIGTNNSGEDSAQDIAAGVVAIVKKLREKLADTRVLVLAIFPRGEKPNPQRDKIEQANQIIEKVADGKMVHYLDIGKQLRSADGSIEKEIMPDFLHLSPKGYEIWAGAIEPKLAELMGEKGT